MVGLRLWLAAAILAAFGALGSSVAEAQGVQLFAVLNGGNEVKSPTSGNPDGGARAGDQDGYGTAAIIFAGTGRLCFSIIVHNITTASAAHIHRGLAGQNGPVEIFLAPPAGSGSPGTTSGCVSDIAPALLAEIQRTPSAFYVNVHNSVFPNGALRGQLF
jgi:hypothetical protein